MHGAHLDAPRIRRLKALYAGLVSQVAAAVARILECLERLGLAESTVVIFTADHGEMLGDHGLLRKGCPYEAAVRVPLLLRWPDRTEAGRVCPVLVSLTDLLPTLLAELGLSYSGSRELEGASLLGCPGGGLGSPRDAVFVEFGHGRRRYDLLAHPVGVTDCSAAEPQVTAELRVWRVLAWERCNGLPETFTGPWSDPRAAPEVPPAAAAPDILWICTDQQRADTIAALGKPAHPHAGARFAGVRGGGRAQRLLPVAHLLAQPCQLHDRTLPQLDRNPERQNSQRRVQPTPLLISNLNDAYLSP